MVPRNSMYSFSNKKTSKDADAVQVESAAPTKCIGLCRSPLYRIDFDVRPAAQCTFFALWRAVPQCCALFFIGVLFPQCTLRFSSGGSYT